MLKINGLDAKTNIKLSCLKNCYTFIQISKSVLEV